MISRVLGLAGALSVAACGSNLTRDEKVATPPSSTIAGPSDRVIAGSALTLSGTASAGTSALAYVEVSPDGGETWARANGLETWTYDLAATTDGIYVVHSRAVDVDALRQPVAAEARVTFDNEAPALTIEAPEAGALLEVDVAFAVSGSSMDTVSEVALVELSSDGGLTFASATGTDAWTADVTPSALGNLTLVARATDLAGNVTTSEPVVVIVGLGGDVQLAIQSPSGGSYVAGSEVTITGAVSTGAELTSVIEISTDGGVTWASAEGVASFSYAWSLPADGAYTLFARAQGEAGILGFSEAVAVVVDNTPPTINIEPIALSAPIPDPLPISGEAADPVASDDTSAGVTLVEISLDSGVTWEVATETSPWSFEWVLPQDDGLYELAARAIDGAGNVSAPAGVAVVIDRAAPTTAIVTPAANASVGAGATVSGTASDAIGEVQQVEFSIDGGTSWQLANGTSDFSFVLPLGDGVYDLRVRATDDSGNVEVPASGPYLVSVDGTGPSCSVLDPINGQSVSGLVFTVSGSADDGTGAGVASVEVSTDGGTSWSATTGTSAWTYDFIPGGNGAFALRCRATDLVGNQGDASTPVGITVDQSLPSSSITSPTSGAALSTSSLTVSGTASSSSFAITLVEVSTDDGATWSPASGTTSFSYAWTGIAEGTYVLRSRATNANGSVEQSSPAVTLIIDRTAPTSSLTSPANNARIAGAAITLTGSASDGGAGLALVEVSTDGGATWATASGLASFSYAWTLGSDGSYDVRARATDLAGNQQAASAGVTIIVDNTAPSASITSPINGAALSGTSVTISGTSSDSASPVSLVDVSTNGGASWNMVTGTTSWSYSWTLPTDGTYALRVRARDDLGNVSTPGSGPSVLVDNTPPSATITAPVANAALSATTFTLTGSASDAGSGVQAVQVSFDGGATWLNATGTTSWSYAWTTPGNGNVTLRARARDNAGNVTASPASVTVLIDKTKPTSAFSSPATGTVVSGASITLTGLCSDGTSGSGVTSLEISTDGGTTWSAATLDSTLWSYNFVFPGDGTFALKSRATDRAGNVEAPSSGVSLTVDNDEPTSTITSPAANAFLNGANVTISGTALDGGGAGIASVEVSTDGGTTWAPASYSNGTFTFSWITPSDGTYTLRSRAKDTLDFVETPGPGITVTVDKTKPTSAITSPTSNANIAALTQSITGTASDSGSGILRVEVSTDGGSTWSTANGTTSWSFSWTLPSDPGAYTLRTRAIDRANNVETSAAGRIANALPNISILSPATSVQGGIVELAGYRFGATKGTSTVTVQGTSAPVLSWSATKVRIAVPSTASSGNVVLTAQSLASNAQPLTLVSQPATGTIFANAGRYASLRLDRTGLPHVAHISANSRQLLYSRYTSGAWTTTVVETTTNTFRHTSLALDQNGVPHISYFVNAGTASALKYARCTSNCDQTASWSTYTLTTETGRGQFGSLALDPSDNPRIAYYDASTTGCPPGTTRCLRYALLDGAWGFETADQTTSTNMGQYTSLAIDAQNAAHVSYYDNGNQNLMYAKRVSATWMSPTILDATGNVGLLTSLAVKGSAPRIAYVRSVPNELKYVAYDNTLGGWKTPVTLVSTDIGSGTNGGTALTIGQDGNERIVYYDNVAASLRQVSFNGTSWSAPATLAAGGQYPSMALDGLDRVRSAHFDGTNLVYYAEP